MEDDQDKNCRLRHGLNVLCLAHIFQYLDSADLYTLGGMNEFYNQIINDFVIPKHEVNFNNLYIRNIRIPQVFERYGKKIRKINFVIDFNETHTVKQLVQSITQYCEPDQLKSVYCETLDNAAHLPNHFRSVEKFEFYGIDQKLSVQLSGTLRFLSLSGFKLDPNFNWKILRNLTELYLNDVQGINVQHFIEFLRLRPKLRVFHHDRFTFDDSTQTICEAMAKYCGNQIQEYRGEMPYGQEDKYSFISGFKNLKKVRFTSNQMCGGDLIDPMKRLADSDTIEELTILYNIDSPDEETKILYDIPDDDMTCIFQDRPTLEGFSMRHFSHLKTITVMGFQHCFLRDRHPGSVPFKLRDVFRLQFFRNVKNVMDRCECATQYFIKSSPKLRHLRFFNYCATSEKAAEILSIVENILQGRKNELGNDDSIEIEFQDQHVLDEFAKIDGRSDSIKLSMLSEGIINKSFRFP